MSQENRMEFIRNLKENDVVVTRHGVGRYERHYVKGFTKTQIILDNGIRIRKEDGKSVSKDYYNQRDQLYVPTEDLLNAADEARIIAMLRKTNFAKYPLDTLRAIEAMLLEEDKLYKESLAKA